MKFIYNVPVKGDDGGRRDQVRSLYSWPYYAPRMGGVGAKLTFRHQTEMVGLVAHLPNEPNFKWESKEKKKKPVIYQAIFSPHILTIP